MNIRFNQTVISSIAGDQVVLTTRDGDESIVLNPVGSWLWQKLRESNQDGTPSAILVEQILRSFPDVARDRAQEDVDNFITKLVGHGMISVDKE